MPQYNFLGNRLVEFDEQLSIMKAQIVEKVHSETQTSQQLASKATYLNQVQKDIAPDFLSVSEILNEVPIYPLMINIFSAVFCLGCSALYHMMYVKNETFQTTLARLDYGGIAILIFGTSFPILYYSLGCAQTIRKYNRAFCD